MELFFIRFYKVIWNRLHELPILLAKLQELKKIRPLAIIVLYGSSLILNG
jgi:hypothetical protein